MKSELPNDSGWRERRTRFPRDMALRSKGFKIEHRPKGKEPIWSKDGKFYTQTEAERDGRQAAEGS